MAQDKPSPDDPPCWTFREIDTTHKRAKGTAFRAFKRSRNALVEGRDFVVLDQTTAGQAIDALRRQERVYASTHNAVLLYDHGYRLVCDTLTAEF